MPELLAMVVIPLNGERPLVRAERLAAATCLDECEGLLANAPEASIAVYVDREVAWYWPPSWGPLVVALTH